MKLRWRGSAKAAGAAARRRPERAFGHLFAVSAAVLFGASTPAAKALLHDFSPWLLAALLYLGAGGGLTVLRQAGKMWRPQWVGEQLRQGDWRWLVGSTVFGGIMAPLLLVLGLSGRDAASASLLLNTEGVFTALIAWSVFHEARPRGMLPSWAAILGGSCLIGWTSAQDGLAGGIGSLTEDSLRASACIVGSCLAWGIDNNLTKRIAARDPLQISAVKGLAAGIINTGLALVVSGASFAGASARLIAVAALVGFLGYGVGLLFFVLGLRHLGAARTAAYFSLAPFIGAGVAITAGMGRLTWPLAGAAALMATGLGLHLRAEWTAEQGL